MANTPLIIFTHVPKVAGTSLRREVIYSNIPMERIKQYHGIKNLIRSDSHGFDAIVGHSPYGIHDFVRKKSVYITMLRDPVQRSISHYYFIKQPAEVKGWENTQQKKIHTESNLSDIFHSTRNKRWRLGGTWLMDNLMTRYLSGYRYFWMKKNSRTLLDKAKNNLEKKYVEFGIQEQYEASANAIANALSLERVPLAGDTKLKRTLCKPAASPEELEAIRDNNELDMELYRFAVDLFNSRR